MPDPIRGNVDLSFIATSLRDAKGTDGLRSDDAGTALKVKFGPREVSVAAPGSARQRHQEGARSFVAQALAREIHLQPEVAGRLVKQLGGAQGELTVASFHKIRDAAASIAQLKANAGLSAAQAAAVVMRAREMTAAHPGQASRYETMATACAQLLRTGITVDAAWARMQAAADASAGSAQPSADELLCLDRLLQAGVPTARASALLALMKAASPTGGAATALAGDQPMLERALLAHRLSSAPTRGELADVFELAGHAQRMQQQTSVSAQRVEELAASAHAYALRALSCPGDLATGAPLTKALEKNSLLPYSLGILAKKLPSYQIHDQAPPHAPAVQRQWQRLTECVAVLVPNQSKRLFAALPLEVRTSVFMACNDKITRANEQKSSAARTADMKGGASARGGLDDLLPDRDDTVRLALLGGLFRLDDLLPASERAATQAFEAAVRPLMQRHGPGWDLLPRADRQAVLREVFKLHQANFGYGETQLRFITGWDDGATPGQGKPPAGADERESQMGMYDADQNEVTVRVNPDRVPASSPKAGKSLPQAFEAIVHELTHRYQHDLAFRYLNGSLPASEDRYQQARLMAASGFAYPVEALLRAHGIEDAALLDSAYLNAPSEQHAHHTGEAAAASLATWLVEASAHGDTKRGGTAPLSQSR